MDLRDDNKSIVISATPDPSYLYAAIKTNDQSLSMRIGAR